MEAVREKIRTREERIQEEQEATRREREEAARERNRDREEKLSSVRAAEEGLKVRGDAKNQAKNRRLSFDGSGAFGTVLSLRG